MVYRALPILCALLVVPTTVAGEPPPARVKVALVEQKEIETTISHTGLVDFDRISALSGETSGVIIGQHAVEGKLVKAGEPLVELSTDFIRKDMDIKRRQREEIDADLEKVASALQRLENLIKTNAASRQAYDDARFDHRSLLRKRDTLGEELERLRIQLDKSVIRAPFDGIVLNRLKERGEWVSPGTAVINLASVADVIVRAAVSENLIRFQQQDARVPVSVTPIGVQMEGRIAGFSPEADRRSKSVSLKVSIPYREGLLRNMSATLSLPASERRSLHVVPRDALVHAQGRDVVYSVKEGAAVMIPVNVVTRSGPLVGIADSAIEVGMPVVVDGNDRLRPGQATQIIDD